MTTPKISANLKSTAKEIMTIRLDSTRVSVVVTCTLCPWWSAFAFTKEEGWAAAGTHEEQVHPDLQQARNAGNMNRSRALRVTLDTPTSRP